jgi:acetylglutamate kinase
MVLSAAINKRLVRQLAAAGLRPVGISGEDGALLPAALFEHGALGAVGTPRKANRQVVDALFDAGFVPVISPVGYDVTTGDGLNINGDDAAAAIAVSLDAEELFLLADVPGVLASDGSALAAVTVDGIEKLLADRVAHSGMAAKLDAARRALLEGVRVVRIGDTTALRDRSRGTVITHSPTPV